VGFLANLHGNGRMRVYKNSTHFQLESSRENRSIYPNKPYIARNWVPGEPSLSLTVWEYLHSFLRRVVVLGSVAEKSSQTGDENRS